VSSAQAGAPGLRWYNLVIECEDPRRLADFWLAALGWREAYATGEEDEIDARRFPAVHGLAAGLAEDRWEAEFETGLAHMLDRIAMFVADGSSLAREGFRKPRPLPVGAVRRPRYGREATAGGRLGGACPACCDQARPDASQRASWTSGTRAWAWQTTSIRAGRSGLAIPGRPRHPDGQAGSPNAS
jgi:hypothetical protein